MFREKKHQGKNRKDNWLNFFAVYTVVLEQDSPMGNGSNYFLSETGDGTVNSPKWKIVPYDHNNVVDAVSVFCDPSCSSPLDWSIVRSTCRALSENPLVGPLLLDPELHAKYQSFTRYFVEKVYTDESFLKDVREH